MTALFETTAIIPGAQTIMLMSANFWFNKGPLLITPTKLNLSPKQTKARADSLRKNDP
jgi:hypothetical protein